MITMTYFHPWTLRKSDASTEVPYAGELRSEELTWQDTMREWLDGNLSCKESMRFVGNFLSVHRVRPQDDHNDIHSSDAFSDEELVVKNEDLETALTTRIGGRQANEDNEENEERDNGTQSHYLNSSTGLSMAQQIWKGNVAAENVLL